MAEITHKYIKIQKDERSTHWPMNTIAAITVMNVLFWKTLTKTILKRNSEWTFSKDHFGRYVMANIENT